MKGVTGFIILLGFVYSVLIHRRQKALKSLDLDLVPLKGEKKAVLQCTCIK